MLKYFKIFFGLLCHETAKQINKYLNQCSFQKNSSLLEIWSILLFGQTGKSIVLSSKQHCMMPQDLYMFHNLSILVQESNINHDIATTCKYKYKYQCKKVILFMILQQLAKNNNCKKIINAFSVKEQNILFNSKTLFFCNTSMKLFE